ncbi:MAG TPA: 30S ribosomal protein S6 [Tepidisphaeraceae bacterium]|jgi:small subunit ribosomal protein S6|nr:30S ribosomal protein S6 [Tepidisphaeraceae bacterium]
MAKAKAKENVADTSANTYEAMFLLGSAFAADMDNALKLVRTIVERHEGKAIVLKKWDERKLAYEIRGEKRGLYVICFFTAPPASVGAMVRDVELSDQILRVMVTKADHLNAEEMAAVEPQPIIPREERNTWDRPQWEDRPAPRRDSRDRPPRSREESAEAMSKE